MTTTLVPEPPAARAPLPGGTRCVPVRANLLPDDVVTARRVERVRRQVLAGLVGVAALLAGWFAAAWWQTSAAHGDLADAQHRARALRSQQGEFAPLVQAQAQAATIRRRLQQLMATDVPWRAVLADLQGRAPAGVALTGVTAAMTAGPGAAGGTSAGTAANTGAGAPPGSVLNASGRPAVAQLTVTGQAGSQAAVAAYADGLAAAPGLASPLVTSVTAQGARVSFSLTVLLTTDALGGRFARPVPAAATGGK